MALATPRMVFLGFGKWARADRIYLTEIHREFEGDARFPEIGGTFSLIQAEEVPAEIPYTFKVYERNR